MKSTSFYFRLTYYNVIIINWSIEMLIELQNANRARMPEMNKRWNTLLNKIAANSTYPTLKDFLTESLDQRDMFLLKRPISALYDRIIERNAKRNAGSRYSSTWHAVLKTEYNTIKPNEFKNYKIIVLSGLESFMKDYFYRLKSDPQAEFDYFDTGLPVKNNRLNSHDWAGCDYQHALLLVNIKDLTRNYLFGLIEQYPFTKNHQYDPVKEAHDKQAMRQNHVIYRTDYGYDFKNDAQCPVEQIDSHLLTWALFTKFDHLHKTSKTSKNEYTYEITMNADPIGFNDQTANLWLLKNPTEIYEETQYEGGLYRMFPFISNCQTDLNDNGSNLYQGLNFYLGVINFLIKKVKIIKQEKIINAVLVYQGHRYKKRLTWQNDFDSFQAQNAEIFIDLLKRAMIAPENYAYFDLAEHKGYKFESQNSYDDYQRSYNYGFSLDLTNIGANELNSFFYNMRESVISKSGMMWHFLRLNPELVNQIKKCVADYRMHTVNTKPIFQETDLPKNKENADLTKQKSGLEEITDILGTNDNLKKAFVENNSAFVLDGRNSIKEVYTTHFEKEL